jgi:hypothetical protein
MSGTVEREIAKDVIARYSPGTKRITVGADKGFDTTSFVVFWAPTIPGGNAGTLQTRRQPQSRIRLYSAAC